MIRPPHSFTFLVIAFVALVVSGADLVAGTESEETAWDALMRLDRNAALAATEEERRILRLLTVEQVDAFLEGAHPAGIALADGSTLEKGIVTGFDLSWWSVDGGGGASTGGGFALTGAIGQPDTGESMGGGYLLAGGLFAQPVPTIFFDGFESGDTSAWSSTTGGPS